MSTARSLVLGLGLFGSMACFCLPFGQKPASIGFSAPTGPITEDVAVPLEAKVLDDKGAEIPNQPVTYRVDPAEVALVTASGDVRCTATGDAVVTLTAGTLTQSVPVACRVVAGIEASTPARVVLGKPAPLTAIAKDAKGNPMKDVPVAITSSDEKVLVYADGKLEGKAVGRAAVQLRAGAFSQSAEVGVAEQLITESLSLEDGRGLNWALAEGVYEVEVGVTAMDGSPSGVTVSWVGTDCPPQPEAQKHSFVCVVKTAASLQVFNPTKLGMGAMESGYVNVYRVPPTP